jgi:hypothetical protein
VVPFEDGDSKVRLEIVESPLGKLMTEQWGSSVRIVLASIWSDWLRAMMFAPTE